MIKSGARRCRLRNPVRCAVRSLTVRLGRRLDRNRVRRLLTGPRGPDDLSQALSAFRKALRARRRLAKLAPHFFDAAVVDREAWERAERRRRSALLEPLYEKYYGPSSETDRCAQAEEEESPMLPDGRTQQAVVRELAGLELWLLEGQRALERYHQRQPHALPSLSQLARLLDIASQLGRMATGLESSQPDPPPQSGWENSEADLERAYGRSPPGEPLISDR